MEILFYVHSYYSKDGILDTEYFTAIIYLGSCFIALTKFVCLSVISKYTDDNIEIKLIGFPFVVVVVVCVVMDIYRYIHLLSRRVMNKLVTGEC